MTSSSSNNNNNSQVPIVRIALSSSTSSAQQKLDSLLQQESEFNDNLFSNTKNSSSTSPPNTTTTTATAMTPPAYPTEATDNTMLKYPTQAHLPSADLPTYDYATIDMPPSYASHNNKDNNNNNVPYDSFLATNDLPWPITKKLYIIGFVFWPLWFIGMGFSIFGKKNDTRKWGRRCAWNSLVILIIFAYMVVAYIRTNGRLVM